MHYGIARDTARRSTSFLEGHVLGGLADLRKHRKRATRAGAGGASWVEKGTVADVAHRAYGRLEAARGDTKNAATHLDEALALARGDEEPRHASRRDGRAGAPAGRET